ncbi:MAG: SMI1/KNR4 family protein [Bacteroidetes bacterium]|nr:SMI1/KNR4 family protein [Bacteroidota bacterium]
MKLNYLSFLNEYIRILGSIEGLNDKEINQLEIESKIKLPNAYKEFLKLFGKKSGQMLGSYLTERHKLSRNRESAKIASIDELDNKQVEIKDSYFFFAQWQGYNFFFFDCAEGKEDPPVYLLTDSPSISLYKKSFTDFIKDEGLKPLL